MLVVVLGLINNPVYGNHDQEVEEKVRSHWVNKQYLILFT